MSKINLWNTISLAQTGRVKLLDSGRQLFGTVVQHGINDKTVTVRVSSRFWNHKFKKALYSNKSKQVHDENNYCVTGDRVIIGNCFKMSNTKAYYVKSIVKPIPRLITQKSEQPAQTNIQNQSKIIQNKLESDTTVQKTQKSIAKTESSKRAPLVKKITKGKQVSEGGQQNQDNLNDVKQAKQKDKKSAKDKDKDNKEKKSKEKSTSPRKSSKKSSNLV